MDARAGAADPGPPLQSRPLRRMLLLALLLALGLPRVGTNATRPEPQFRPIINCHICEQENSFDCKNSQVCGADDQYCNIVVISIFPRFFLVAKSCSQYCPVIEMPRPKAKPFILLKPLPFLYVKCCTENLCNEAGPKVNETAFREHAGRASEMRCGNVGLVMLLALASMSGLCLL
ncbi:PREDICTED: lymphocyte antigen 6K isoform X1 [Galeopterus variegatus]|uniref:Lymphocyte antigen 6K isoform X1 n=1 Tax=Galeopterus variegatus TaxID=482537 RepID=A0ABM0RLA9_GALVR|nr:PREDICTED: lymphocyte antigen 6K isoform X1 [Galeopterus variegatus]